MKKFAIYPSTFLLFIPLLKRVLAIVICHCYLCQIYSMITNVPVLFFIHCWLQNNTLRNSTYFDCGFVYDKNAVALTSVVQLSRQLLSMAHVAYAFLMLAGMNSALICSAHTELIIDFFKCSSKIPFLKRFLIAACMEQK